MSWVIVLAIVISVVPASLAAETPSITIYQQPELGLSMILENGTPTIRYQPGMTFHKYNLTVTTIDGTTMLSMVAHLFGNTWDSVQLTIQDVLSENVTYCIEYTLDDSMIRKFYFRLDGYLSEYPAEYDISYLRFYTEGIGEIIVAPRSTPYDTYKVKVLLLTRQGDIKMDSFFCSSDEEFGYIVQNPLDIVRIFVWVSDPSRQIFSELTPLPY